MTKTVVGLYDDIHSAQQVVQALLNSGFSHDEVSLLLSDAKGDYGQTLEVNRDKGEDAAAGIGTGVGIGAGLGGLAGLLLGLGLLTIPGIGPVVAAGPLAAALTGAGIGAAVGGIGGALASMGVSDQDAASYAEGIRRGGTLVTVASPDEKVQLAVDILDRYNPVDITERSEEWQASGLHRAGAGTENVGTWPASSPTDFSSQVSAASEAYPATEAYPTTESYPQASAAPSQMSGQETRVPIVQEQLQVGKEQQKKGGVRVHTYVTETPVEEQIELREERVSVERRPADRPVSVDDMNMFKEGTIEVTETVERPVISKQARVIEEVVIRTDVEQHTETIQDTVRRTDVDVEHLDTAPAATTNLNTFDTFDTDFRSHFTTHYQDSDYTYEQFSPVYRYGYTLANNADYSNRSWEEMEPTARTRWEERNPGTWDRFKDSVRYAWDRVKSQLHREFGR